MKIKIEKQKSKFIYNFINEDKGERMQYIFDTAKVKDIEKIQLIQNLIALYDLEIYIDNK